MFIGCHISSAKGFAAMGREALSIGANTFAFFTRNPRGGNAKAIDPADADALRSILNETGFGTLVAHAPYTLNACAAEERTRAFARLCFSEDFGRMEALPHQYYNFHPGSHVGQGIEKGIELTGSLLKELLPSAVCTTVLIETMAGQGTEIGSTFEEVAAIIEAAGKPANLGVCLDTCHVFAAGYDIRNAPDEVLTRFDKAIGLERLKAIHCNDSMRPLGSHRDRHERIGAGEIGFDALFRFVHHAAIEGLPVILETPNDSAGYAAEIRLLRGE